MVIIILNFIFSTRIYWIDIEWWQGCSLALVNCCISIFGPTPTFPFLTAAAICFINIFHFHPLPVVALVSGRDAIWVDCSTLTFLVYCYVFISAHDLPIAHCLEFQQQFIYCVCLFFSWPPPMMATGIVRKQQYYCSLLLCISFLIPFFQQCQQKFADYCISLFTPIFCQ